jgi:hypothetical protein
MKEEKNIGYLSVEKTVLWRRCLDCLAQIETIRKEKEDKTATDFMETWNKKASKWNRFSLLRKFFPKKVLGSVEESKEMMDYLYKKSEEGNFGFGDEKYNYRSEYAWNVIDDVKRIRNCCEDSLVDSTIMVDIKLYACIITA